MAGPYRSRLRSSQKQKTKVHFHRGSSELEDTSDDEGDHSVNDDSSELITSDDERDHSVNDDLSEFITSDDNSNHSVNDDYSRLIESSGLHISEAPISSKKPIHICADLKKNVNVLMCFPNFI